ncbi:MAG: hypothetical protein LBI48_10540, partial [Burkholderiaceae bacterium]|nr:hypothetical protein [Burkholderiaceae bacterium]
MRENPGFACQTGRHKAGGQDHARPDAIPESIAGYAFFAMIFVENHLIRYIPQAKLKTQPQDAFIRHRHFKGDVRCRKTSSSFSP